MSWFGLQRNTFARGIHPPAHKDTRTQAIRRLNFAPRLILPLNQHIGKPAIPIVHKHQEVVRGEPIARADGFFSVPLHAPATGVIEKIDLMPSARGPKVMSIVLRVYSADDQTVRYGQPRDMTALSPGDMINAIQETGMVGLGGAAFPTHAKLSVPEGHTVDTLIINGCECEPYLTTDHRVMIEWLDELLTGIAFLRHACGASKVIIGIEDNKDDAARVIAGRIPPDSNIEVRTVRSKYPQGSEKLLITVLTGKEVPSGGFPYDVGCVVQNTGTAALLGRLLPRTQGLIERVVTFSGPGIDKPGNYLVAIGTPMDYVLDQLGFTGDAGELILGGPMMGSAVASLDVPITKATSGILAMPAATISRSVTNETHPCIHCGRCLQVCPLHLNPCQLGLLAANREYETMQQRFHLQDCFECGSCSYICPANIPLVQYFRIAKAVLREQAG